MRPKGAVYPGCSVHKGKGQDNKPSYRALPRMKRLARRQERYTKRSSIHED